MKAEPKRRVRRAGWLHVSGCDRSGFCRLRPLCLLRFEAKANDE